MLADAISDVFKTVEHYEEVVKDASAGGRASKKASRDESYIEEATITDAEASKLCSEWQTNYHVIKGVSWGDLPYDLQQQWVHYSCDSHATAVAATSTSA